MYQALVANNNAAKRKLTKVLITYVKYKKILRFRI